MFGLTNKNRGPKQNRTKQSRPKRVPALSHRPKRTEPIGREQGVDATPRRKRLREVKNKRTIASIDY